MSKGRKRFEQHEERLRIYARDHGICQACGEPVDIESFQIAHRIANTVANRRHYGNDIIDHPMNKATTHAGRCNDAMNCGQKPYECSQIVDAIKSN
jgi:Fe2+ or Zn2+ uptake regulation protein